jgi:outer membrane protein OmpA-like peptidoglycan-associated protein
VEAYNRLIFWYHICYKIYYQILPFHYFNIIFAEYQRKILIKLKFMKQKLTLILAIMLVATSAFAQKNKKKMSSTEGKKGQLIGLHFNLADFNAPTGLKDPITGKVYQTVSQMDKGLSVSYWRGITSKVDFCAKINAMFKDYRAIYYGIPAEGTEVGVELEPTINVRPVPDNAKFAPFLTAGVGVGYYTSHFGAYIPVGLGLQLNIQNTTYFFLQAQYKFTLTKKTLGDNLFYSFGVAENIGREKVIAPPPPPPPPPPVVKDRDGDGVLDDDDRCPDTPGLASLKGCPDRDGDGIADIDDKCPDVPGLARYQGCPIPDRDKDGINDEEDKCPDVFGYARYQGCPIPDTDKDGVNDEEDKCINEPGPASNFGCPVIPENIIQKVNLAAKNVFFATGSSKLLPKSFPPLKTVIQILKDNPTFKVNVEGHTDSTGKYDMNMQLSKDRAASVAKYLVDGAIDESRISSEGFGPDRPIAPNKTTAGRAKNRRVEMKLRNY